MRPEVYQRRQRCETLSVCRPFTKGGNHNEKHGLWSPRLHGPFDANEAAALLLRSVHWHDSLSGSYCRLVLTIVCAGKITLSTLNLMTDEGATGSVVARTCRIIAQHPRVIIAAADNKYGRREVESLLIMYIIRRI